MNFTPIFKWAQPYSDAVLNFIYPPFCIICKARLESGLTLICQSCRQNLPRIDNAESQKQNRANLGLSEPEIAKFLAVWEFTGAVQEVIHEIKFFGKKSLAKFIGRELAALEARDKDYLEADIIIPVPLQPVVFNHRFV